MRWIKWYLIAAFILLSLLVVRVIQLRADEVGFLDLYGTIVKTCDALASVKAFFIASAFVVGLIDTLRQGGAQPAEASLLVVSVGALMASASLVSWYGVASTNEISVSMMTQAVTAALVPIGASFACSVLIVVAHTFRSRWIN